jgi:hypothetical protein
MLAGAVRLSFHELDVLPFVGLAEMSASGT